MILLCDCANSTADILHGKGLRPHTKLVKLPGKIQEYLCHFCSCVRTRAEGFRDEKKPKRKPMREL